ncbi:MAG TPA: dipeptidase [Ktedonobacteraceae bacterium]|nr:dipeptidase [Ktedonobacteraceae bacterium]
MSILPFLVGHNDTLLSLYLPAQTEERRSFFERSEKGDIDLPRAREAGLAGGFFAVFVPVETRGPRPATPPKPGELREQPIVEQPYAMRITMRMVAGLYRLEAQSEGQVKVVRTVPELVHCLQNDVLSAILHFEGAEAIDPDLDALEVLYQAGLRSLGLVWSRSNAFAQGVPFGFPHSPDTGPGLTDVGRELVRACNRLGIMIDLSHLNEQGFWDVEKLSDAPLVATHSNAYAICPSTRNLTDKQLDAIHASQGLVGVNFGVQDLREDGRFERDTPLDIIVRHLDYLVDHLGIDGVAFGTDFDGTLIPSSIGDVTGMLKLFAALQEHSYDESALRKLAYENWLRVLAKTWK